MSNVKPSLDHLLVGLSGKTLDEMSYDEIVNLTNYKMLRGKPQEHYDMLAIQRERFDRDVLSRRYDVV